MTQAFKVAMFTPVTAPQPGQAIVVTASSPPAFTTEFEDVAAGASIPSATAQYQVMTSGPGPTFPWTLTQPGDIGVATFEGRNGDVTLASPDVITALGFTPYSNANLNDYQSGLQVTASINAAVPTPSSALPLMDQATALAGTAALYARSDHVHPTDASRYDASNPAGYQTAMQVLAVLPLVPAGSNAAPLVDSAAAAGSSSQWARGDHVHPTDLTRYAAANPAGYQTQAQVVALFPTAATLNPLMDGIAAPGVSTQWACGDHVHPTDSTRYAATNPSGFQTAAQVSAAIAGAGGGASPSNTFPLVDGVAAAGTATSYARGDHVHPTDASRAPIANPVFTGTVTLAADPTQALQAVTMQYVANYAIDCGTY